MATENPRVAAYPPRLVYERLVEFKRSLGLKSDSAAIVAILEAYFFGSTPSVPQSEPLDAGSLEKIISEPLDDSLDPLPLVEENNHPKVSWLNSEPLNDLLNSSLEKDESKNSLEVPSHLTGAALARRLNVSPSTLRHKKNARNFEQWTSLHDPDGIAWHFDGEKFIEKTSPGIQ